MTSKIAYRSFKNFKRCSDEANFPLLITTISPERWSHDLGNELHFGRSEPKRNVANKRAWHRAERYAQCGGGILKSIRCISVTILFLATQLAAQANKPEHYTVIQLGSLGGTSFESGNMTINDRSWVDSASNLPGDMNHHAFVWIKGQMTDLGTLGGPNSNIGQMNDRGDVTVGGADTGIPDPFGEDWCGFGTNQICLSFIWNNGVRTLIPTLGGNNADVADIDSSGQLILGFAETTFHDPTCIPPQTLGIEAFLWNRRTNNIQVLPPLAGDSITAAFDMNDNGEVAGTSGICTTGIAPSSALHAVIWRNGVPIDLGNLGGNASNVAFDLNNHGQVVGISTLSDNATVHTFLWQDEQITDLGTLPGDTFSFDGNINDKGQVPIQSCDINFNCRAAIWQDGVMTDMNTLVPSGTPLYLVVAGWVNSRGQIVGGAVDQNGDLVPFLATPVDDANANVAVSEQATSSPRMLPENVRKALRRTAFRRFRSVATGQ
jgi:probable HAF family extracellular repeat protein